MSTLTEFLLARIAEDEAMAQAVTFEAAEARDFKGSGWYGLEYNGAENEAHAHRWNPPRVLAECMAKRRIVNRAVEMQPPYASAYQQEVHETLMEDALPALALPYADHPDYDPRWTVLDDQ